LLHPDEGSLDHVVPRSRGGADTWENLVWSAPAAALVKTFVDLAIAQGPASMGFDRVTSGY
jgi:hypothetical protein